MHAFRTLRSPCHQRPQRPPCPIGRRVPNRRRVSKRRHRVPQRRRCVTQRRRVTHHRGVTNGPRVTQRRRVTHHRVSLTAPASLTAPGSPNAAVSLITGMSLTAAASPTAANGCRAIGIVTYKMQFDSEICAIYMLQTSQTHLASPHDKARRANCSRVLNETSESGIEFTRLVPNSPRLTSSRLVAISAQSRYRVGKMSHEASECRVPPNKSLKVFHLIK